MKERPIPPDEWRSIVANVPLVSVDLIIEHDGGVLLGKRENQPAKGEWFVPGGTVLKNERRIEAIHRVAEEELGESIIIDELLGTFDHFYETSEIQGVDSKHYVATAYRCHFERDNPEFTLDNQHIGIRIFRPPFEGFHPHVQTYFDLMNK